MSTIVIAGERIPVRFSAKAGRLTYRLTTTVLEVGAEVRLRIELRTMRRPWRVAVYVTGVPVCLRHRYREGSLCMWWELHPNARRRVMSDGLEALVQYARSHLFQEACCRTGLEWPGEEAPGQHPRRPNCPTCGGVGP